MFLRVAQDVPDVEMRGDLEVKVSSKAVGYEVVQESSEREDRTTD